MVAKNYTKISIVTPSFNQASYLMETMDSILSQNYPNLEYIIIDGGSTDGSVDIIRKYERYLTYWISEADNGHANALNKGFAKSTGEIMAWLNSDDKYFPWTFQLVNEIFQELKEIQWLMGRPTVFRRDGVHTEVEDFKKNRYEALGGNFQWIQQESVFWRRNLWKMSGSRLNEKYSLACDLELWLRFFHYTNLFHATAIIGGFRKQPAQRSQLKQYEYINEAEMAIADTIGRAPKIVKERVNILTEFQNSDKPIRSRLAQKLDIQKWHRYHEVYFDYHKEKWVTREVAAPL